MAAPKKAPGKSMKSGTPTVTKTKAKKARTELKKNLGINFLPYMKKASPSSSEGSHKMSYRGKLVINQLLNHVLGSFGEALRTCQLAMGRDIRKSRITMAHMNAATGLICSGELGKHAKVEGLKSSAKLRASY